MKVAIISESDVDQAVVSILAGAVLGTELDVVPEAPRRRAGGWNQAIGILPAVIKWLQFNRTDVDGLVVVIDSDDTPIGGGDSRLQLIRSTIEREMTPLLAKGVRTPLKTACGLAVPCLEAWLRYGVDPHVTEAAWHNAMGAGEYPYDRKRLKSDVYGSTRNINKAIAIREAERVADNIDGLRATFPVGFGSLADDLDRWVGG